MKNVLTQALKALDVEIEAVRKFPSKETIQPSSIKPSPGSSKFLVEFDPIVPSLRFAEECKARTGNTETKARLTEFTDKSMTLEVDTLPGTELESIELEWENDFVLKKMKERLTVIQQKEESIGLTQALFAPQTVCVSPPFELEVYHDENRNERQIEAIEKAVNQPVSFVWGPPGTGKTSSLGFIAANFLLHGKTVLLASNTNRAVDISLLSVFEALEQLGEHEKTKKLCRFGEIVIEDSLLDSLSFTKHVEQVTERKKQQILEYSSLLDRLQQLTDATEELLDNGKSVPDELELQLTFVQDKIAQLGGQSALEVRLETGVRVFEQFELAKFSCVATTLAKVCSSDLLDSSQFDAVIIDEASMANLPYLLVLASKAKEHIVLVGDPMQLPPISTTDQVEQKQFLELDIFTYLSGADSVNALFQWHDKYPEFTSFFDTQYRLNADLAQLVSTTFYEGRLKTKGKLNLAEKSSSYQVIDTQQLSPFIVKKSGDGFKPMNSVHIDLTIKILRKLIRDGFQAHSIGIIVPFRSVLWDYRKTLQQKGFHDVEIGTVHTFQGREKSVILFDTVMSGEGEPTGKKRHYTVRPFDELKSGIQVPRLLNVAFSRSKELFLVLADMKHIETVYRNRFLYKLLDTMLGTQFDNKQLLELAKDFTTTLR